MTTFDLTLSDADEFALHLLEGDSSGGEVQVDSTPVAGLQLYADTTTIPGQLIVKMRQLIHQRFALVTAAAATPTLAQFQAGIDSMTDELAIPAQGAARVFLHFADIFADPWFIGEDGERNSRRTFGAGVALADQLAGVTYYRFSSNVAVRVTAAETWVIRQ